MLFNEQTKELYKDYARKICLVTGNRGFIGTHLCSRLTELGATVYGFDIKIGRDIRNKDYLTDFIDGIPAKIDYVFHLAALTEVVDSYARPREYYETNFLGTLNVLEEVREREIPSLVVASTDKVYGGSTLSGYLTTDHLVESVDPYSHSKRAADILCQNYVRQFNIPVKILRSVNTYGPGQRNATTLITNTINLLLSGSQPVSYNNALIKMREWLYIDDAIQAYLLFGLLNTTKRNIGDYDYIYNVGSGEILSPLLVINRILDQMKSKLGIRIIDNIKRSTDHQFVESSAFRNLIKVIYPDWEPTKIDEGLQKTIAWHQEQKAHENEVTIYGNHSRL